MIGAVIVTIVIAMVIIIPRGEARDHDLRRRENMVGVNMVLA